VEDIRIPHKGNIQGEVIEGAFRVLDEFEAVGVHTEHTEAMKVLQLEPPEEIAFAQPRWHCASGSAAWRKPAGTDRPPPPPSN
jgi:hypothetical protein